MFNAKKIAATVAIFGAGLAAFSTSSVSQAEPVSNSYAIVGSDTLEDVVNAIVNGTAITGATVRVTINGATLGSFDATGAPYIITKPGGVRFSRPNGSGEGFQALSASLQQCQNSDSTTNVNSLFTSGTYQNKGEASVSGSGGSTMPTALKNICVSGQVDISRSSSGDPKTTSRASTAADATIVRVPFARDAIAIVMAPALANAVCAAEGQGTVAAGTCVPYLTAAQLGSLYETPTANPSLTINGTSITFAPVIPQAGSGTRKDFLGKIVTGTNKDSNNQTTQFLAAETAGFVRTGQEHDATSAAFLAAGDAAIEPMSASRWIAMKNGASYDKSGTAVLGAVSTSTTLVNNVIASPVTVTSGVYAPNSAYYADTTWGRDTYLFVERARIDNTFTAGDTIVAGSKYDANLAALLDPTLNNLANTQTTGASKVGKVKLAYGFLSPLSTALAYYAPSYVGTK